LHASANGKAMLAAMPEPDLRRVLNARLEGFTKNTLTTPTAIRAEIDRIRAGDGIAYDREEQSVGVCAVGAVIGTVDHDLLAFSVPLPKQRFTGREDELRAAVLGFVNRADEWIASRR
jgi:DNA-binding IclR family transcriptional regulator